MVEYIVQVEEINYKNNDISIVLMTAFLNIYSIVYVGEV